MLSKSRQKKNIPIIAEMCPLNRDFSKHHLGRESNIVNSSPGEKIIVQRILVTILCALKLEIGQNCMSLASYFLILRINPGMNGISELVLSAVIICKYDI